MVTQQQGLKAAEYFADLKRLANDYLDVALIQGYACSITARSSEGIAARKDLAETSSGVVIVRLGDAVLSVTCEFNDMPIEDGRLADVKQSVEFRGSAIEITEEVDARLNFIPLSDLKSKIIAKKLAGLIPGLPEVA